MEGSHFKPGVGHGKIQSSLASSNARNSGVLSFAFSYHSASSSPQSYSNKMTFLVNTESDL